MLSFVLLSLCLFNAFELNAYSWLTSVEKALLGWTTYLVNHKKISPQSEQFYRSILHKAQVDDADSVIITSEHTNGVFVTPGRRLGVDENWIQTLPLNQREFLLGHEAGHLAWHHMFKKLIAIAAFAALHVWGISPLINKYMAIHYPIQTKVNQIIFQIFLSSVTILIPTIAVNWYQELQATEHAIKTLNCIEGANDYHNWYKSYNEQLKKENYLKFGLKWLIERLYHPPVSWHEAVVKKMATTNS